MTAKKLVRQITFQYNLTIEVSDLGTPALKGQVGQLVLCDRQLISIMVLAVLLPNFINI